MARKTSELQDQIADVYSELAVGVLRDRGFHMGENLTMSQAKSMASDLKGLENTWRSRAQANRSIGH
jgi:hypothetical protein